MRKKIDEPRPIFYYEDSKAPHCPTCFATFIQKTMRRAFADELIKFCPWCGQELDWSENESTKPI